MTGAADILLPVFSNFIFTIFMLEDEMFEDRGFLSHVLSIIIISLFNNFIRTELEL